MITPKFKNRTTTKKHLKRKSIRRRNSTTGHKPVDKENLSPNSLSSSVCSDQGHWEKLKDPTWHFCTEKIVSNNTLMIVSLIWCKENSLFSKEFCSYTSFIPYLSDSLNTHTDCRCLWMFKSKQPETWSCQPSLGSNSLNSLPRSQELSKVLLI